MKMTAALGILGLWAGLIFAQTTRPVEGPSSPSGDLAAPAGNPSSPERMEPPPPEIENLDPIEKLGQPIPLDLEFTDENGRKVRLGDYFGKDRPVILNLGYFRCPMLCGLILNGLTEAMRGMSWMPGREYEVLSISFDARETPQLAYIKKQNYLKEFGRPGAGQGWHFLVGEESPIQALCNAVGYRFVWNERQNEYAHASVLVLLSPRGVISRYLYGVTFDPMTLRLSLAEASEGKVVRTADRVLLYCFQYDAAERRYALAARRLMSLAGGLTVLCMACWLVPRWIRERRPAGPPDNGPDSPQHGA